MSDTKKVSGPANADEAKGRLRKAWGELTGDEEQKRKGNADIATGKVKHGIDKVREKVDELTRDTGKTREGPLDV